MQISLLTTLFYEETTSNIQQNNLFNSDKIVRQNCEEPKSISKACIQCKGRFWVYGSGADVFTIALERWIYGVLEGKHRYWHSATTPGRMPRRLISAVGWIVQQEEWIIPSTGVCLFMVKEGAFIIGVRLDKESMYVAMVYYQVLIITFMVWMFGLKRITNKWCILTICKNILINELSCWLSL